MPVNLKMAMYEPIILPRNKRHGNNCWEAKGTKVGLRDIILYSDLEFDHWLTIETDLKVKTYCEQPLEISYVLNGNLRTSIFDMWVQYVDGTEMFIEVKYEAELNQMHKKYERTKRQIEAQKEWCMGKGVLYEVRTEKTIRSSRCSIENRLNILSNVTNQKKPACTEIVIENIQNTRCSLGELYSQLSEKLSRYDIQLACQWLYFEGKIDADLDEKIWSHMTEVWKIE